MCSCHSVLECCVMFSGVKLSMESFVLLLHLKPGIESACLYLRINFFHISSLY